MIEFVVAAILEAALGALISYLVVRWLPMRARLKRVLYCVLVVLFFTPLVMPIAAAGVFIYPALVVGFGAFSLNPQWNSAFLVANVLFALWACRLMFIEPPPRTTE